jgi:autophagy-related protein 27
VCGVKTIKEGDEEPRLEHWVALAGDYSTSLGIHLDVKPTRIKHSASNADQDKEGVRLEMTGGREPFKPKDGKKGTKQKAIIELLCDKEKSGWEPDSDPNEKRRKRQEQDGEGEDQPEEPPVDEPQDDGKNALKFVSYGPEPVGNEAYDVLRLTWNTKYACEGAAANVPSGEHWGFFTWMIIM